MTDRPILTWYVRAPHDSDVTMDFDLIVRAYDKQDALDLWFAYWTENGVEDEPDYDPTELTVLPLNIQEERGVVSWH